MRRDEILQTLSTLLPAEFEAVVFRIGIPRNVLSGAQVPQTMRAIEVITYLEGRGRIDEVLPLLLGAPQLPPYPALPIEYENNEVRATAERLESARSRRRTLLDLGEAVEELDREILMLRSRLRQGGQIRVGDVLGERYVLIRQLGSGGFGLVWDAHDRGGCDRVAVKVLHPDQARDASRRERFFRGARVMQSLDHPAVVRVVDPHGEDDGYYYFAMELVPGGDLRRAVLEHRLAPTDVISLMVQVSDALGVAHARGIVHRDVKPGNILLDAGGQPKLTDFDLVSAADTTGGTRTGHMGTYLFMAPEATKSATARTDVYALGMTTIFCLFGRELPPTALRQPEKVIAGLPCNEATKRVLMRAIELEPEVRYADARVFGAALRAAGDATRLGQGERGSVTSEDLPPPTPESNRPRRGGTTTAPPISWLQDQVARADGRPVRLGRYEVTQVIGRGGTSAVYAARDVERNERVALKTPLDLSSRSLQRLKAEFRSLAGVFHPNLVSLYELSCERGEWFFTMDCVEGVRFAVYTHAAYLGRTSSLPMMYVDALARQPQRSAASLPDAPFHEGRLRAALVELATGVAALHAMGKVHGDLNPTNVLVTPEGRVVVVDFGLISDRRRPESLMLAEASGTPSYMSPEQFWGEATAAGDWYSVGVMLFEALTGRLPFGGNTQRMRAAKQRREAPRPSSLVSGVPEDLDNLCASLLRRAASERPDGSVVLRLVGAPAGPRARAVPARLLGRRAELYALREAYHAAERGEAAVVLVHGPPGAGKTALCERFVDSAVASGAVALRGTASERERIPHRALDPVVDAVATHLVALGDRASALVPPEARELARLFPVLAEVPAIAALGGNDEAPRDPRSVATRALGEILRRMAGRVPVVVWIDDIEHAEPLDAVIDALTSPTDSERRPLLVLSGACDPQVVEGARRIHLDPLAEGDASALAGAEVAINEQRAMEVARAAAGTPRLVVDLAAFVAAAPGEGVSLEAMFEARLGRLSNAARRLVEVLAAARAPIPQAIAFDLASVRGVASSAVLELGSAGLARSSGTSASDTISIEPRVRGAILRHVPPPVLMGMHIELADALGRWPGADPELIALHLADKGVNR